MASFDLPAETGAVPSRLSGAVWRAKVTLLQAQRLAQDLRDALPRHRPQPRDKSRFPLVLARSETPLWSDETIAERRLQLGKVQNLRCAVRALNGLVLPAGQIFSFWRQIGRTTAERGYAPGRELREGCVIPSPGGGLCQLSNALYGIALDSQGEIVERHRHTRTFPGSSAAAGRDATVFWNYRDLRFRFTQEIRIEAQLTRTTLVVQLRARSAPAEVPPPVPATPRRIPLLDPVAHGCLTCGESACFRHNEDAVRRLRAPATEPSAFLLEECWPEFQRWVSEERIVDRDRLAIPIHGALWRTPRYAWDTAGFARVDTALLPAVGRALEARRLRSSPPATVRAAQLRGAERLACALARTLTADVAHLRIAISLLPYLWREGHLGGRTFDVVLTRQPLAYLHQSLDEALARFPERRLLGDFRAPEDLVAAEAEALAAADRIITPHAEIARRFGKRAVLLPWLLPRTERVSPCGTSGTIAFPGPAAARKGAYEVREAARALGLTVLLIGKSLEGPDFWEGIPTRRSDDDWLSEEIGAVVQPAVVEDQPRALLRAIAAGLPVIATAACGLGDAYPDVTTIPALDAAALVDALRDRL